MRADTKFLLNVLRNEYVRRLDEVLGEVSITDDEGNVIIQNDLKVRHKASGYEYTVDRVIGDDGDYQVILREPEEPRFEAPPEGEEILGGPKDEVINEDDLIAPADTNPVEELPKEPEEEVVFVIDQAEFEKNYEVD